MTLVVGDRIQETTTTTGTGTITLLGAVTQFQSFAAGVGNGNSTYYTIADQSGVNWEEGIGTYTTSGSTLTRTVLASSNAGALVNFPAGTKNVFCSYPAEAAVLAAPYAYPTVSPTLNLDFANSATVDPRITFVRNSTATYYDGKTYAMAEQNLLTYSQTIGGTGWAKPSLLITLNTTATTAPDGSSTSSLVVAPASSSTWLLFQTSSTTSTSVYTVSVFVKTAGYTNFLIGETSNAKAQCSFDLSSVTYTLTIGNSASITSVGNGWYRCTVTFAAGAATSLVFIGYPTGATLSPYGATYTGDGTSGIYIWGAQLEQRSSATAYTPTTTTAITNYIPVLMTAPAGVPRLDYNPTTGQALGLLIEESRTNLVLQSAFASGWTATRATTTLAADIAPDGTQSAVLLVEDTSNNSHFISISTTVVSSTVYTCSVYAKANTRNYLAIYLTNTGVVANTFFNLATGTIVSTSSGATSTINSIGNGWYRCCITVTTSATSMGFFPGISADGITASYQGNGYSGIYIWGAQLEAGSFATSYIPTTSAAVTRTADQASMTGTNFSSWYNQTESTIYAECIAPYLASGVGPIVTNFTNSALQGAVYMYPASNQAQIFSRGNGGAVAGIGDGQSLSSGVSNKLAGTFKVVGNSTLAASICSNGRSVLTNTSLPGNPLSNIDRVYFGFQTYTGTSSQTLWIKKVTYYPVALSSNNLVALTS